MLGFLPQLRCALSFVSRQQRHLRPQGSGVSYEPYTIAWNHGKQAYAECIVSPDEISERPGKQHLVQVPRLEAGPFQENLYSRPDGAGCKLHLPHILLPEIDRFSVRGIVRLNEENLCPAVLS